MKVIGRSVVLIGATAVVGWVGAPGLSAASKPSASAPAKQAKVSGVHRDCTSVVDALDTNLDDLSSRLPIGLALDAYSTRVGAARFSYDKLLRSAWAHGGIDDRCDKNVVAPLASALSAYISAYETWSACVGATRCTFEKGTPPLKRAQAEWLRADVLTGNAERALRSLEAGT
jgi:hypothetical protein